MNFSAMHALPRNKESVSCSFRHLGGNDRLLRAKEVLILQWRRSVTAHTPGQQMPTNSRLIVWRYHNDRRSKADLHEWMVSRFPRNVEVCRLRDPLLTDSRNGSWSIGWVVGTVGRRHVDRKRSNR